MTTFDEAVCGLLSNWAHTGVMLFAITMVVTAIILTIMHNRKH